MLCLQKVITVPAAQLTADRFYEPLWVLNLRWLRQKVRHKTLEVLNQSEIYPEATGESHKCYQPTTAVLGSKIIHTFNNLTQMEKV